MTKLREIMDSVEWLEKRFDSLRSRRDASSASSTAERLKSTLGEERFLSLVEELKGADKGFVLEVAEQFMGRRYPSKTEALKNMEQRHTQLLHSMAKLKHMAGRSAG